jgi:hypothetical protein
MIYPYNDYESNQRLPRLCQSGSISTCTFDCLVPRSGAPAMSQGLNRSAKRAGWTSATQAMYANYYTVNIDGPPVVISTTGGSFPVARNNAEGAS